MPEIISNKWIALTTVNQPTEDVKVAFYREKFSFNLHLVSGITKWMEFSRGSRFENS